MTKKKILIATGGTGGHVFPAYSLANFLINKNFRVELTTDKRGIKYLKNYKNLRLIKIFSSPLVKKNFFTLILSSIIIIFSILKSFIILLFDRPSIIFGMGGYSSFPICIAASILKIKFIIYENNLLLGKANRYLLPFADKIFVAYKEVDGISQKYSDKVVRVGNIVREDIINFNLNKSNQNKFDILNILILGGSQAAQVFADKLPPIFEKIKKSGIQIKIYQQCQKHQNDQLSDFYKKASIEYEIFNFTDKIIKYYSRSNLVITRSGASVLGELINVKIPFISIPLPTSADNHQYKNAEFYFKKGYGYLLEEKDINNKLFNLINLIYSENSSVKNILSNQRQYSDKDIFRIINDLIQKILNEKN